MEALKKAQQQMKELEASLAQAAAALSAGQGGADLSKAQATMKALEADLNSATAALGLSDSVSTTTGPGAPTPGTSVMGDAAATTAAAAGPALDVTPGPRVPYKLSLTVRKNIRDEYDNKKPELEKALSAELKQPWTMHVDTYNVLSYAVEGYAAENPGNMFESFFSGAVDKVQRFVKKNGDEGRTAINQAASHHVMTLEPVTDAAQKAQFSTVGCDFHGGKLRLLFHPDSLGWSASDCLEKLNDALDAADAHAAGTAANAPVKLPFNTRVDIRDEYDKVIPEVLALARAQLQKPALTFTPNFAANYAAIATFIKDNEDGADSISAEWARTLGARTKSYFEGFAAFLRRKKFDKDDMLREGFEEAVEKADVQLRVVSKAKFGDVNRSCDVQIEDGVCYLQTTPTGWGWSTSDVAEDLLDRL